MDALGPNKAAFFVKEAHIRTALIPTEKHFFKTFVGEVTLYEWRIKEEGFWRMKSDVVVCFWAHSTYSYPNITAEFQEKKPEMNLIAYRISAMQDVWFTFNLTMKTLGMLKCHEKNVKILEHANLKINYKHQGRTLQITAAQLFLSLVYVFKNNFKRFHNINRYSSGVGVG